VGSEKNLFGPLQDEPHGGESAFNAMRIADLPIREGDVEVGAQKHPFTMKIEFFDRPDHGESNPALARLSPRGRDLRPTEACQAPF
jgi:hypothetical protein